MITEMSQSAARMIRIMATGDPEPRCEKMIYYPNILQENEWYQIFCPLRKGHKGLHADNNYAPFFTDEDAEWFETQYNLWKEGRD